MGFSGVIAEGYGAGKVTSQFLDKIEVLESGPDKVTFNVYQGSRDKSATRYALIRTGGKNWVFYNYTASKAQEIPDSKPKYKEIKFNKLILDDDNEVMAPKLDGAHNTFILRPNKRIDVYSYRKSKNSGNRIDHSYRTELYKTLSPKELGDTIVRGELFLPGEAPHITGGVLNSNVFKSREKQKEVGKLDNTIFDVVKYKGRNVEKEPYSVKLDILKKINRLVPELKLPDYAIGKAKKKYLYNQISAGTHPQTDEGVVVYKLDKSVPYKSKRVKDYDVEIVGTFPAKAGSKYQDNAVGGFIGKYEGAGPEIRIGGGLSDKLRRDAYKNPHKYVGE